MKILKAKIEAIEKTGAERVVTSNPGCYMQLLYAAHNFDTGWKVTHISQMLRESMDRGARNREK